jgi:hypothetical protein
MAFDDASIPSPDSGGGGPTKIFGLPMPVVLIAGGGVALLAFLTLASKSGSQNANMVPISTAVQLGDIQERQLDIMGQLGKGFQGASEERRTYAQGQLEALSATQLHLTDQLQALNQDLSGQITNLSAEQRAAMESQRATLLDQLSQVKTQQQTFYNSLMGRISDSEAYLVQGQINLGQNIGSYGTASLSRQGEILNLLQQLWQFRNNPVNNPPSNLPSNQPPGGPTWNDWYAGWQAAFGATGGPYDINRDNIVDIRDYGIGRSVFGV